jgi:hypothetical protein
MLALMLTYDDGGTPASIWCLLDTNIINLRTRYIRSAANLVAEKFSRRLDFDEQKLDPVLFAELDAKFGGHSIDRFSTLLP